MTGFKARTQTDLKKVVVLVAFLLVLATVLFQSQFVHASDPDITDCAGCHHFSMERHRFPTSACTTCHSPDMSTLTLKDGKVIPIQQDPTLCAQCHGQLYQAWRGGKHGIATINCTGCHDPHFINNPQTLPLIAFPLTFLLQMLVAGGTVIGISLVTLVAAARLKDK